MPTVTRRGVEIFFEAQGRATPFMFFSETACAGEVWKLFPGAGVLTRSHDHHPRRPRHETLGETDHRLLNLRHQSRRSIPCDPALSGGMKQA